LTDLTVKGRRVWTGRGEIGLADVGWLDVVQVQKEAPPEEQDEEAETKVRQKQGVLSIEREPGFL
jgi:hypothetical protein